MDDHVIDIYLKRKDLNGMKEFISRDGNVLKCLSRFKKTALKYMLRNYGKAFNDMRDEAILYLIEEEAKARQTCPSSFLKFFTYKSIWYEYMDLALRYSNCKKVLLKLIHTAFSFIPCFNIDADLIYKAIENNCDAEIIATLLKYYTKGEIKELNMLLLTATNSCYSYFYFEDSQLNRKSIDILFYHGADFLPDMREYKFSNLIKNLYLNFNGSKIIIPECCLNKILSYYAFFLDQNDLFNYFPGLSDSSVILSFIEECKVELGRMKCIFLTDTLTLDKFCHLKKYYKSDSVYISCKKLKFNKKEISDLFPIYSGFINIRIEDNLRKRWDKAMCDMLENIVISPINNLDCMLSSSECLTLNYDCLYYVSKYLNSEDLYKLFLASNSVLEVC